MDPKLAIEDTTRPRPVWRRDPVVWLGTAVFAASVAGCAWMVVLGLRYHDEPLDAPRTVFTLPLERASPCLALGVPDRKSGDSCRGTSQEAGAPMTSCKACRPRHARSNSPSL